MSYEPYNRGDSLFMISALPSEGVSLDEAKTAIEKEMNLFKTELVNQTELDRVKNNFISNLIYSQDDISGQANMIGKLEVNGLSFRLIDELPKHYDTVTPQDLQRIANIYFVKENLSSLYLTPETPKDK